MTVSARFLPAYSSAVAYTRGQLTVGALELMALNPPYQVFGEDAVFSVAGADIVARVIRDTSATLTPAAAEYGVRSDVTQYRVRRSEVADQPARGSTLTVSGVAYTVDGADPIKHLEWLVYARAETA